MRTKQDMKLVQLQRDVWNWDFVFQMLLSTSWHPDLDAMGFSFLFTHAVAKAKAYVNIFLLSLSSNVFENLTYFARETFQLPN